jgi:S-disulfanyl-L-cysteine oxidoreductase SoxD
MNSNLTGDFSKKKGASSLNRRAVLAILLAGVIGACASGVIHSARASAPARTTMDGVFTDGQAARGKAVYNHSCAYCHMDDLSGSGQALPLAGDAFMDVWDGQSLGDLFDLVHTTMPQDKPESLTPESTVDVVTYLLQANQFPSGKEELKNDPDTLKTIIITKKSSPKQ